MYSILIVIFLILYKFQDSVCSGYPNNITLTLRSSEIKGEEGLVCDSLQNYTLLDGEEAEVIVRHDIFIENGTCYWKHDKKKIFTSCHINQTQKSITRMKIVELTAAEWQCEFLTPYLNNTQPKKKNTYCNISVHIRLISGPKMVINDDILEAKRTDLTNTDYDYTGKYHYKPGSSAYVSCKRPNEFDSLKIQFKHIKSNDSADSDSVQNNNSLTEYNVTKNEKVLINFDNREYLDCVYETAHDTLRLRVFLFVEVLNVEKDYVAWIVVLMVSSIIFFLITYKYGIPYMRKKCKHCPTETAFHHFYTSQNNEDRNSYVEISNETTFHPNSRRQFRRIPGMTIDRRTGLLTVNGIEINVRNLLEDIPETAEEAIYENPFIQ